MGWATDMSTHLPVCSSTHPLTRSPARWPAEVGPEEFQAWLADPQRRAMALELAGGLQKLMAAYSGLMEGKQGARGHTAQRA
jgi:hypothetical protein